MPKAIRPFFLPNPVTLVEEKDFEFEWFVGTFRHHKQRNVFSFHEEIKRAGYSRLLEISTYSPQPLGVKLSAFNLRFVSAHSAGAVEELYQKSKNIGEPDRAEAQRRGGRKGFKPLSFEFENFSWPLQPPTAFYDWLYINALRQNQDLSDAVLEFDGFTDIAFNPKKSLSTQARSAALYSTLVQMGKIESSSKPEDFLVLLKRFGYMTSINSLFA